MLTQINPALIPNILPCQPMQCLWQQLAITLNMKYHLSQMILIETTNPLSRSTSKKLFDLIAKLPSNNSLPLLTPSYHMDKHTLPTNGFHQNYQTSTHTQLIIFLWLFSGQFYSPALHTPDNFWTGLKGSKVSNKPQEGPGDREEAWGWLGAQTWRKWATWTSRRESCLRFSVLSSTWWRLASQGQGSLQQ